MSNGHITSTSLALSCLPQSANRTLLSVCARHTERVMLDILPISLSFALLASYLRINSEVQSYLYDCVWGFNLPNHSSQHMTICGLSLHQGSTESRKNLRQKFIFQIGTLNPILLGRRGGGAHCARADFNEL